MPTLELITGQSPKPAKLRTHIIDKPYAWDDLGPRGFAALWWHRTIGGAIEGTDDYFSNPNSEGYKRALTDFGIGLSGWGYQWNDPWGRRAPWASGPWNPPGEGDGAAYVDAYGIDGINRDGISIECEGLTFTSAVTESLILTAIDIGGWVVDHKGIPWTAWPNHPDTGLPMNMSHHEATQSWYKLCAGANIDELISTRFIPGIRDYLKHWQTRGDIGQQPVPQVVYATPHLPPRLDKTVMRIGQAEWTLIDRKVWVGDRPAPALEWGTPKSRQVRAPLPAGSWFNAVRLAKGDRKEDEFEGSPYYWVTPRGIRIPEARTRTKYNTADKGSAG